MLLAWFVSTHVLAAFGVLYLPIAWISQAGLLLALAAHAYLRRPSLPECIVRNRQGLWSLPESGHSGLSLSPASRRASWWVELRLVGADGTYRRLLCRDQVAPEDWRVLQLVLRRPGREQDLS